MRLRARCRVEINLAKHLAHCLDVLGRGVAFELTRALGTANGGYRSTLNQGHSTVCSTLNFLFELFLGQRSRLARTVGEVLVDTLIPKPGLLTTQLFVLCCLGRVRACSSPTDQPHAVRSLVRQGVVLRGA